MWKTILFVSLILSPFDLGADSWPQWRGSSRDGSVAFRTQQNWPKQLRLLWKTRVGSGVSSPVVDSNRVWIHTREDNSEVVSCLNLPDGRVLWRKSYDAPFTPNAGALRIGKGPFATPLVSGENVFTFGISAILSAFDTQTGVLRWQKNLGPVDASRIFCGTSSSPILESGLLIVHSGDDRSGAIFAFDPTTGKEIWKHAADSASYASPIMAVLEGERQIVAQTNSAVIGLHPKTGKLLWSVPFVDTSYRENIITPVVFGKIIVVSNRTVGATAFEVRKEKGEWRVAQKWNNPQIIAYMSSPVLSDRHVFGMSIKRKGELFCLDAATGDVLWTASANDIETASILQSNDYLFVIGDDATLTVAKKSPTSLEILSRYTVAESSTWSHPAMWGRNLLVKDDSHLLLWSFE